VAQGVYVFWEPNKDVQAMDKVCAAGEWQRPLDAFFPLMMQGVEGEGRGGGAGEDGPSTA
jgi:hypothetical protein